MRKIFLDGAELWLEKHGLSKPENVGESRKDQQFNDLVRHFFKHGDAGQIALFRMALEDHRKKNKLPA
jgi:hypothetical protein